MTKPIILGLDPSKCTGWSIFNVSELSPKYWGKAFECGVFDLPKEADLVFTADQIGQKLAGLLKSCKEQHGRKPDFAVIEGQFQAQAEGTAFASSLYPWIAVSSITSTLARFQIPYATIMPSTWRASFFGEGFKPEFKVHQLKKPDRRTGKTERIEWLWKPAVIARCEELGIELPRLMAHKDDAAEACAIAYVWNNDKIKFHARRYQQPWVDLRIGKIPALQQGRNERVVAA